MGTRIGLALPLLVMAAFTPAQAKPKPGAPHVFDVPFGDGRTARAHGYTPGHHLDQGRYPLVVVLGDRENAGATTIRALPHAVVDRKLMVVVAPDLGTAEFGPTGFARLCTVVPALIEAAAKVWSIDERRVFLLGTGRGAAPALALARELPERFVAVAAFAPKLAALAPSSATAKVPALLVTPGGKALPAARALQAAFAASLPLTLVERPEVANGQGEELLQPLLEWFLEWTLPKPTDDKDRVKGRTVAARGSKSRVIVIKGEFDTVQEVLTALEIPHLSMDWLEFRDFDLAESDVLLINCSTGEAYGKVRGVVNRKLRDFVGKGGYLFATDWSLRWPVAEVFSDYVGVLDPGTDDRSVDVKPAPGKGNHDLLQNVFPLDVPLPKWQIDAQSYLVKVWQPAKVDVLLESEQLGAAYEGNKILGVCFRVGAYGGLVLDVVSHFSHQGDGTPTTPMYQLIVNFINAAKQHRAARR